MSYDNLMLAFDIVNRCDSKSDALELIRGAERIVKRINPKIFSEFSPRKTKRRRLSVARKKIE